MDMAPFAGSMRKVQKSDRPIFLRKLVTLNANQSNPLAALQTIQELVADFAIVQ